MDSSLYGELEAVYLRIEEEIKKMKILQLKGFVEYLKREKDVEIDADSVSEFIKSVDSGMDSGIWELIQETPYDEIDEFYFKVKDRYPVLEGENLVLEYFNEIHCKNSSKSDECSIL
jgi:hypothetical protein